MALFGQDTQFFDMLERQAKLAHQAAEELVALGEDFGQRAQRAEALKRLEAEGDDLTHKLANRADEKFITPFDKEDLHRMSMALDDVVDHIESLSSRVVIYRLAEARPDFQSLTRMLREATGAVAEAVAGLRHLRDHAQMHETLIHIHEMENKSDQCYRQALDALFNDGTPIR